MYRIAFSSRIIFYRFDVIGRIPSASPLGSRLMVEVQSSIPHEIVVLHGLTLKGSER